MFGNKIFICFISLLLVNGQTYAQFPFLISCGLVGTAFLAQSGYGCWSTGSSTTTTSTTTTTTTTTATDAGGNPVGNR